MIINRITTRETSILKALSITVIVLHNSLHPFFPDTIDGGNEFNFNAIRIQAFLQEIGANILTMPKMLLAAFGYSGVFLFIFLSAYGISVKYGRENDEKYWPFVYRRLTKLLLPVLLVSTVLLLSMILGASRFGSLKDITASNFLLRLSMLSNFSYDQTWKVVGPWWFLSAIVQFYLVFHALNLGYKRYGGRFYLIISALSIVVLLLFNAHFYNNQIIALRATILGWLPEISLGCYLARCGEINISPFTATVVAILSLFLFALGNVFEPFWVFSSMGILIFMVITARPVLNYVQRSDLLMNFLVYTGDISVYMFLLSGIIREPIVHNADILYWLHSLIALGLLVVNFVLSSILYKTQGAILSIVKKAYARFGYKENTKKTGFSLETTAILLLGSIVAVELFFI